MEDHCSTAQTPICLSHFYVMASYQKFGTREVILFHYGRHAEFDTSAAHALLDTPSYIQCCIQDTVPYFGTSPSIIVMIALPCYGDQKCVGCPIENVAEVH